MKIFIPDNDKNAGLIYQGFLLKPLVIEAYKYHLNSEVFENTQKRFNKKEKTGTKMTSKGKAIEE
jgi:hypothetical protein